MIFYHICSHLNPFSLEQMCGVTHIYRTGKVVLNVYFRPAHLQRCVNIACVNAVFTTFVLLVNVLQTRDLSCVNI